MKIFRKKTKQHKNIHAFDNAILTWRAPEYLHHEKSALWFIIAGSVMAFLVIYGLFTDGWTFSIALIVLAGVYYLSQRHKPVNVEIKISSVGVKIGRHIFPYSLMKGFWIVYNPPFVEKVYLRMASKFHPDIFVSIRNVDPSEVRRALVAHTQELHIKKEPFSDTLVRLFKL